ANAYRRPRATQRLRRRHLHPRLTASSDAMTDDLKHSPALPGDPPERGHAVNDPRPAAVAFVATEHFTLQGARAQTISESSGRASIFLVSLSGGVKALGFVDTAAHVATAFYACALIILPTLASVRPVTFNR